MAPLPGLAQGDVRIWIDLVQRRRACYEIMTRMRRRRFVLLCCGAVLGCTRGRVAVAPGPSTAFIDAFERLDGRRWSTGAEHVLGRTTIEPGNVSVTDGELLLRLPAGRLAGAELRTVHPLRAGIYRAQIQAVDVPDSVIGFFLYSPPDFAREVDIELFNKRDGLVRLTTYSGGKLTKTVDISLPFDPVEQSHEYAIALTEAGVEFYADGALVSAWGDGVPTGDMNLYLNTWYPQWLGGVPTDRDVVARIDTVGYDPR